MTTSACKTLAIDIETYSAVDLSKSNVYCYSADESFQVLLFGYAIDDGPVQVIDLTHDPLPEEIRQMLLDPDVIKTAYNANFERVCLSEWLGQELPVEQWRCSMVQAATLGLPRTLADVGRVLGLPEDKQKMAEGKRLIQYFCKPCKPTKTNHMRTRNRPADAPEKWALFIEYNRRDVETERAIREKISGYPLPPEELAAYQMDQRINDRGVQVDRILARAAVNINKEYSKRLIEEGTGITGLENINSVAQLKGWLGVDGSLNKQAIAAMRSEGKLTDDQDRMLAIRQELGKTSISKYQAMLDGSVTGSRVKGLFAFYGANRTGRWAGRQVQVQNLPQNHLPDLELARSLTRKGDLESLEMLYGNVPATLSELIRTAFVAQEGYTLCVADFSAIEARVIAWLADEQWRMDVFKNGGDIYCASASQMFHVPVEKHGQNAHLRQKGKIAELALGYGGSVGALKAMGAMEMGLTEDELKPLVDMWRTASPNIVNFWWQVDRDARTAIRGYMKDIYYKPGLPHGLEIRCTPAMMHITLPSGRCIRYWKPRLETDEEGRENITYGSTEVGKWTRVETYGPKLVENIVQATARDCLRDAMLAVEKRYPRIVMHIHDEMVVEVPKDEAEEALAYMLEVMARPIPWAPGLLLKGAGYITPFYRKD